MVRRVAAVLIGAHGLVHLIGFVVPFRLVELQGYAYTTSAAWGHIELGDGGTRLVGVLWLLATIAFITAGYGLWHSASWAIPLTAVTAGGSLPLCVLGSPTASAGIAIDVLIIAVAGASLAGRLPQSALTTGSVAADLTARRPGELDEPPLHRRGHG